MSASARFPVLLAAMTAAAMSCAAAQPGANGGKNGPNALQGFQQNRGQPVQIEAASLEVRDKDKVATFRGNVKVVQGDTTMRCKSLVVFYEQQGQQAQAQGGPASKGGQVAQASGAPMKAATPGPGGSSQISRLEATGGVTVTQKEQTATGDSALFDMKSNTVTLFGNVLVSQGANVMRGEKLVVDLTSGVSRVEAGKGPVRMLIQQGPQQGNGAPGSPKFGAQRSNSTN
jgi:lipopolysaccharide export system protein LptA